MSSPFDRSIPGYTELSKWPQQPGYPEKIISICSYRDGGTVGVMIKGENGKGIEFFFERFLGRLCYGAYETKDDAAYIKKGSKFEGEVYLYLEAAGKNLSPSFFQTSDIDTFNQCLKKAKIYSGA